MTNSFFNRFGVISITWVFAACLFHVPSASAQKYSDWSTPVNLGSVVNSSSNDQHPAISPNNLSLYFVSNRPGGFGGFDLWVSQRDSTSDAWGIPQNLGPVINSAGAEFAPAFADGGHLLFFGSDRLGGCGSRDLWVSFRKDIHDDFAWDTPVNLGCVVNDTTFDDGPTYFKDDDTGVVTLYFTSLNRAGGVGDFDIWSSTQNPDGSYNPPVVVTELDTTARDTRTAIRRDGLEIFLSSNRDGSVLNSLGGNSLDVWVATRTSTTDPWSTPVDLTNVDGPFNDGAPAISADGTQLYFYSNRPGGIGMNDLYVSTRTKLKGHKSQ